HGRRVLGGDSCLAGGQHLLLHRHHPPPLAAAGFARTGTWPTGSRSSLMRFLSEEDTDPMLSVVNLIDVFLLIIGVLMILIAQNPLNSFSHEYVDVIENPGEADIHITIKNGQVLTRYESSGEV